MRGNATAQKINVEFFREERWPLMDFALCGKTVKTHVRSLSKKLIPIALIADGSKKTRRK